MDLVITDLEMPEMNGLEGIVECPRAFREVKGMTMSGRAAADLQKATLIGARQTFQKPLGIRAMLQAVQYALQHEPRSRIQAPLTFYSLILGITSKVLLRIGSACS